MFLRSVRHVMSVSIGDSIFAEFTWNAVWMSPEVVHRARSRNDTRVFEIVDHLLVNGKFETGFLNPGRTVIDPLTELTELFQTHPVNLCESVSASTKRIEKQEAQLPANSSSRQEFSTLTLVDPAHWYSTRISFVNARRGQGYQVSNAFKLNKITLSIHRIFYRFIYFELSLLRINRSLNYLHK